MYEWPNDLDVMSVFVGRELEAITFAQNTVYFQLGDNVSLTITSNYVYASILITEAINFPIRNTYLISSIGSKIVKAELFDKKDLYLWFQDGSKLEINGSTRGYECYGVDFNGREFYI